jgi:hypothetical protein
MSHYPDEVWTDWARGVAPAAVRDEIREHIASGCPECRYALEMWQRVADVARRERDYEPPPSVLESAIAIYRHYGPIRPEALDRASRFAELVFDSFHNPLPQGVRSLERATRHLSYKAGSFFIDVRIEEANASGLASVVGQLMHHPDAASMSLEGLQVVLTSGRSMQAETTTNRFGEFVFEMDTHKENHLAIGVGDEFAVVVPLNGRRGEA